MPFPQSERVVFDQNPISEVICQLRFPPILQISAGPPAEFQERLRATYPLFETEAAPGLPREMSALLARMAPVVPERALVNRFLPESRDRYVALTQEYVAYSETKYREWTDFRKHMIEAQRALEDTYKPSFYSRVGLRYLNTINLDRLGLQGVRWGDLLNPSFLSVMNSTEVASQVLGLFTQALVDLSQAIPGAKVTIRFGLHPVEGRSTFVMDNDFYLEGHTEGRDVIQTLNEFNKLDGNLFRWAIRRDGRLWAALGPRAVANVGA
jgi:uncharacterized protein (TIGR04255 family)